MKLSDYVAQFFADQGIGHAFVISGGASVHLIDSVAKAKGIDYICPQHEQGGAMMADAYARETGNLGLAITTSGPGATNLITGICCSWFDSIPCFFLTGQVASTRLGIEKGLRQLGFQETDIVDMVKKVTKYAAQVRDPKRIRFELEKALYLAKEGRPGPVLLDIPDDLQRENVEHEEMESFTPPSKDVNLSALESQVKQCIELINQAERPVVVLGGGVVVSKMQDLAMKIVRDLGIPVCPTWATMDLFDGDDPLMAGGFGISSPRHGNFVIQNCDLVFSIGSRLDTHATGSPLNTFARGAKKILVDIDQLELDKFEPSKIDIDLKICADVRDFLKIFREMQSDVSVKNLDSWFNQIRGYKESFPICPPEFKGLKDRIDSYVFLDELRSLSRGDEIIYVDAGGNLTQTFQGYKIKGTQRLVSAFNNSPMGYALPGAIGASFASGNGEVICLIGDFGLLMNVQELATIAKHQLPVKVFVFNNLGHGIVRQTQNDWLDGKHESTSFEGGLPDLNYAKIGESYGIPSYSWKNYDEMRAELPGVLSEKKPAIIDMYLGFEQKTIPFLKAGRPIEDPNPLLDRDVFLKNMIVEPMDVSKEPNPSS